MYNKEGMYVGGWFSCREFDGVVGVRQQHGEEKTTGGYDRTTVVLGLLSFLSSFFILKGHVCAYAVWWCLVFRG